MPPAKLDFFSDFLPRGSEAAIPCPCAAQGAAPDAIGPVRRSGSAVARWSVLGRWAGGEFWVGVPGQN